jgi:hypothetical protein
LALYSSCNMRSQVSYPYKTAGKVLVLCLSKQTTWTYRRIS